MRESDLRLRAFFKIGEPNADFDIGGWAAEPTEARLRNRVWIPLALSVLCAFFVSRDLDRISSFDSSFSQGKSAETTFESNEQTRAQSMQSTAANTTIAAGRHELDLVGELERTHRRAFEFDDGLEDNLDTAAEDEILRVLRAAIEKQREFRPLFISSGIVDAVASGQRVRVIFEIGPDASTQTVVPLLEGSDGRALFDALRVFPLLGRGAAAVGPLSLL